MRMLFLNLPVRDLAVSTAFFAGLGFRLAVEFSDDTSACLEVDRNIFLMLLAEDRFRDFVNGDVSDARAATEVITSLSVDSREQVDELVARAIASGGRAWRPSVDAGAMYGGSFQDPDGHVWELVHLAAPGRA